MINTTITLKKYILRHSKKEAKETGSCPHAPTFGELEQ